MTEITATGWEKLVDAGRRRLQQGDSASAESSFSAAVAEAESLGPTSPALAACLTALAQIRTQQRDHDAAEALFRRALEVREQAAEFDHAGIIQILGYLATLNSARADYDEAETLLLRALSLADRFLPAGHAAIGSLLNNLARLYFKRGDHEKADRMLVRLLQIKQTLGTEHPEVAGVLASIAALRSALGKHDVAEQLWRRVLAIREKSLPSNDPALISTLNSLADACAAQGEQEEALHFRERGLRLQAQSVGTPPAERPVTPQSPTPVAPPVVQAPVPVAATPSREHAPVPVRPQTPVVPTPAFSSVQQAKITPIPLISIEPPMPAPPAAQGVPTPVAPSAAIPPGAGVFGAGSPPPNGKFSPGASGGFSPGTSGSFSPGTSGGFSPGTSGAFSPGTSGAFSPGTSGAFSPSTSGAFTPSTNGGFSPATSGSFTPFAPNPPAPPPAAIPGTVAIAPVNPGASAPAPALPPVVPPAPPAAENRAPLRRDPDPAPAPSARDREPSLERPRYQGYSVPSKRRSHVGKAVAAVGVVGLIAAANLFMDRRPGAQASPANDSAVAEPAIIRIPAESLQVVPAPRQQSRGPKALTLDSALAVMKRHAGTDSAIAAQPADSVGGRAVIRIPSIDAVSRAVEAGTRARVDSAMTPISPRTPGFVNP